MKDLNKLVRENVKRLTPYSCARDDFKGNSGIFLDANENPYGNLNRYPDPYQKELKEKISAIKGIEEERIFLGNGSDEIIDLCYRVFCNPGTDKVILFPPTYGMYSVAASVNDIGIVNIPLKKDDFQLDLVRIKTEWTDNNIKLAFICSPNNPTANAMNFNDVESFISDFSGIVVVDEAYIDFSDKPSFLKLIYRYPNLIVMQTLSKAFGMASVRIGMMFTNPDIVRFFNKMKAPYNISTINQKAALGRLQKTEQYNKQVSGIKNERKRLFSNLEKISLVEKIYPSDANFLLIKVKDADFIYNTLVTKNIMTRNRTSLVNNCIRITVGTKKENDMLIKALKSILL